MHQIELKALKEAFRSGFSISGVGMVLGRKTSPNLKAAFVPPFTIARFQTQEDPVPSEGSLSLADFERLSVYARSALGGVEPDPGEPSIDSFPCVSVENLRKAIGWAKEALEAGGSAATPDTAIARGLQLIGCRITTENGLPLNLGNIVLPFSLRLIGCVIECPIQANNCELVTLDLSGSAMNGLDALGLRAKGSVRLRRSVVLAPTNFSRARIEGEFDATDFVIGAQQTHPRAQLFSVDQGMLNLSETQIGADVHLQRARIWGGLNIRGATLSRSIFLDDALVAAPVAVVEKWAWEVLKLRVKDMAEVDRDFVQRKDWYKEMEALGDADIALARVKLHNFARPILPSSGRPQPSEAMQARLWELEAMRAMPPAWQEFALDRMLSESMRVRTSAIRGDNLVVHGSLSAQRLRASGRVRFKFAKIDGNFNMSGARLRSVAAVGRNLDGLYDARGRIGSDDIDRICRLRHGTNARAAVAEVAVDDDYALDAREAHIGGDLSFGAYLQRHVDRAVSDAKRDLKRAQTVQEEFSPDQSWEEGALTDKELTSLVEDLHPQFRFTGVIKLGQAKVDGAVEFRRALGGRLKAFSTQALQGDDVDHFRDLLETPELWYTPAAPRAKSAKASKGAGGEARRPGLDRHYAIDLRQAVVGRDIDFRESRDIVGVNVEKAKIGGSLRFSEKYDGGKPSKDDIACKERAVRLRGQLNARGAEIKGDAQLLFDPARGPALRCEFMTVAGRLDIYPQTEVEDCAGDTFHLGIDAYNTARTGACCAANELQKIARELTPGQWADREKAWYIDLRNARATVFCHPPPAWPRPDGLSIAGFFYERTTDMGPLAPHPFAPRPPPHTPFLLWLGITALSLLVTFLVYVAAWILIPSQPLNGALLAALAGCFVLQNMVVRLTPRISESEPMAIGYLARQKVARNRYKRTAKIYWSLDPYVTAAHALREEGRSISANVVEAERLKRRAGMFSIRHHPLPWFGFGVLGFVANYGFNLSRTFAMMLVLVVAGSVLTSWSRDVELLVPKTSTTVVVTQPNAPVRFATSAACERRVYRGGVDWPTCPAIAYALDLVVPFLSLGEREKWELSPKEFGYPYPAFAPRSWRPAWVAFLRAWPSLFRLFGIGLATIMALALGARAQSAFARVKE